MLPRHADEIDFSIGMTLEHWGIGVTSTVIDMDQDFVPPKWVKLRDNEDGNEFIMTEPDYDFV